MRMRFHKDKTARVIINKVNFCYSLLDTYVHFAIVNKNKVVAAITGSPVYDEETQIDNLAVKHEAWADL